MTNRHKELNPQAFRVFGPKMIGMREGFADPALESRFFTEYTGTRSLRSDIPVHLPDSLHAEALELRNRLLAWRFYSRYQVGPDPSRLVPGLEPRLNQSALALLSLVDDETVRERIGHELMGWEARVMNERASTPEAIMLACLRDAFADQSRRFITVAEITNGFNLRMAKELGSVMTPKWIVGTKSLRR